MKKHVAMMGVALMVALVGTVLNAAETEQKDELRIVSFGAHPDDAEIRSGGTAMLWNQVGAKTLLVSTTNGDVGHSTMAGGALANRRLAEVEKASKILGTTVQVWDIHDGELMPTLENRKKMIRTIRRWEADVIIAHRPYDYHPDHRYTGVLMQDSAFMVAVPYICPDVKPLKRHPVFLYSYDHFTEPRPFRPDILVPIDSVIEKRIDALLVMESQFIEGGAMGQPSWVKDDGTLVRDVSDQPVTEQRQQKIEKARETFRRRFAAQADKYRQQLIDRYGPEVGKKIRYVEAFEICPYGRQPSQEEIREIFPFLPNFKG